MRQVLALLSLTFCLAGCASEAPSPLNANTIKSLQLTDVVVTVPSDAEISWGNAEHEYQVAHKALGAKPVRAVVETGSLSDPATTDAAQASALAASPEGKAFVRDKVASRVKTSLETTVKPALQSGARPVRLEVAVHSFVIPSALQRLALGGVPIMTASAVLKDAATGEVIASQPGKMSAAMAGNGWAGVLVDQAFSDLDVRVADSYSQQYRAWLLGES
jgi:hypothetical protein